MTPAELASRYFQDRLDFCRREGIPITTELLATHVTGAILVAVDEERERCARIADQSAARLEAVIGTTPESICTSGRAGGANCAKYIAAKIREGAA